MSQICGRQVPMKRLRSRGSEASHLMRDFGIEAQLAKFADLRKGIKSKSFKSSCKWYFFRPKLVKFKLSCMYSCLLLAV